MRIDRHHLQRIFGPFIHLAAINIPIRIPDDAVSRRTRTGSHDLQIAPRPHLQTYTDCPSAHLVIDDAAAADAAAYHRSSRQVQ